MPPKEFVDKCIEFNYSQAVPGSILKTLKGSKIQRDYKYGLGKRMSNKLYFHRCYYKKILQDDEALKLFMLADSIVKHDYNIVRWDSKLKEIALEEVPDFDTAREPVVGKVTVVAPEEINEGNRFHFQILHHKWTMVDDHYVEFDIAESWSWSKEWLCCLPERADGSSKENWIAQLRKYNLE